MTPKVIITCAVTGGDDTGLKYPNVPVAPTQIATAAVNACAAGAAIAHIHVRNPETGTPSMELALYREVVERIRASGSPVIINLTTGPGARFIPSDSVTNGAAEGSYLRVPANRVRHNTELPLEICSLDTGSLNFGRGALINVPAHIEAIASAIRSAGVKPELEVFDTGHLALSLHMIDKGLLDADALFQIVLGRAMGRARAPGNTVRNEKHTASRRHVDRVRHRALGISDGGAGRPDGWQCACRHRGQSVPRTRRAGTGNHATYLHALVVSPDSTILADGGDRPGIMLGYIDPARADAARQAIPFLTH